MHFRCSGRWNGGLPIQHHRRQWWHFHGNRWDELQFTVPRPHCWQCGNSHGRTMVLTFLHSWLLHVEVFSQPSLVVKTVQPIAFSTMLFVPSSFGYACLSTIIWLNLLSHACLTGVVWQHSLNHAWPAELTQLDSFGRTHDMHSIVLCVCCVSMLSCWYVTCNLC